MRKSDPGTRSAVLIQARMSSGRFPGKMMSSIGGMPLVEYVYRRCAASSIRNVRVITSDDTSDDELFSYCGRNAIPILRGNLHNVLERYRVAGRSLGVSRIVRVCGDTPFVDIPLMERLLEMVEGKEADYAAPDRKTCLPGFYSEACTLEALDRASLLTDNSEDLEHVTKFIVEHPDRFRNGYVGAGLNPDFARGARLTIDYPDDLVRANAIVGKLKDALDYTSEEILDVLRDGKLPR